MESTVYMANERFYKNTVAVIEERFNVLGDYCLVFVQHAFLPTLNFYSAIDDRIAAVIPKGSSARSNPDVVALLTDRFGPRFHSNITRSVLANPSVAVAWLRTVTMGRPFAILEYGGYFAPAAIAISNDQRLGKQLLGFVEGTENGVKGSDDGQTPGYKNIVGQLNHPVISKSRSRIKNIMDIEIGPAIVYATDGIFRRNFGCSLSQWRGQIGVVGLGAIGKGVHHTLVKDSGQPLIYDSDLSVMAELAVRRGCIVSQETILRQSDLLFFNTGSCFISQAPELLGKMKDNVVIVLCTSGDVEGGIPQLVSAGHLTLLSSQSNEDIAVFTTCYGTRVRVLLACDGIGQAPNMSMQDGSSSPANLMSDMEFYALGSFLASAEDRLEPGKIHSSPEELEELILMEWLREFYPDSVQNSGKLTSRSGEATSAEAASSNIAAKHLAAELELSGS